jgi:nucleoside-diphosphate-sugar epimerase
MVMNKLGNMQQLAFVTGGSGFVGGRLIEALVAQGWQVRALVRGKKAAASVAALGAVPVLGELTDQAAVSKAMAGSTVVFHVAALFKMWGKQKDFNAVNVEGTRTLVEAAVATPSVRKVIMVSAGAVVQGDPEPLVNIDERAPSSNEASRPTVLRRRGPNKSCSRRTRGAMDSKPLRSVPRLSGALACRCSIRWWK